MRIAQIAPLFESVPPRLYGGTERVVHYLTEELVKQGHRVTLFASADSITSAELVSCTPRALRLDADVRDSIPHQMLQLDKVRERADEFDVLHFHTDYLHFPLFRAEAGRTLTTLHGRQDLPDHLPFYAHFAKMPLVSISNAQRAPLTRANFVATVYHGLPLDLHKPTFEPHGRYLAFLGRISPEKGPERAIAIARAAGIPLKMAAKVDKTDEAYFREVVAPMLNGPGVEFIGEINETEKTDFLGQAAALLFPIDWPEPFGLVLIEAMACGTPVLAFGRGSVPEIVEDRRTGRVVSTLEEAVQAMPDVLALDRRSVRAQFEERFSAPRMAADYLKIYQNMARRRPVPEARFAASIGRSLAITEGGALAALPQPPQSEAN
ncbi:glycosyltransferase family 4 protein [Bradyrhizobium canariense]|uniref:glycosyltransferase family 4 protein n=1 Tax=Bradyrhizobium canariense TaxID=255045 RepID=UPI000A190CF3|nr:glycosyltransferase family 4 protein [Bradyrhizobium canariense]OSI23832.1 glycosyl transferase [Bradyrhizobium canariense]OSI31084.1 glycosyl transferase [Bradyrhizobium canariense]OSI39988.1 glycosyl transferase [Bradyrhizobium canariense]OSI48250.1 glycosyl transferase [Bradyrhizobium canariense]OSI50135.1 glycosyl transferase [Bradyrhizobium canariense]